MGKLQERTEAIQCLTGTSLKMTAVAAMAVQHFAIIVLGYLTGAVWFPRMLEGGMSHEQFQRIDEFIRFTLYDIGDVAYPLFFLFIAEGFRYTRDRGAYLKRMLLFALLSEIPFDLAFFNWAFAGNGVFPFYWGHQNIFFTYFLAVLGLWGMESVRTSGYAKGRKVLPVLSGLAIVAAASGLAEVTRCDYGAQGVILIAAFYLLRDHRLAQALAPWVIECLATGSVPNFCLVIGSLLILLYNGKRGSGVNKYFFYLFYPVHILAFYLATLVLGLFL